MSLGPLDRAVPPKEHGSKAYPLILKINEVPNEILICVIINLYSSSNIFDGEGIFIKYKLNDRKAMIIKGIKIKKKNFIDIN